MKYKFSLEVDLIRGLSSPNSKRQRELQESSTVLNKNAIVKKANDKNAKKQQDFMSPESNKRQKNSLYSATQSSQKKIVKNSKVLSTERKTPVSKGISSKQPIKAERNMSQSKLINSRVSMVDEYNAKNYENSKITNLIQNTNDPYSNSIVGVRTRSRVTASKFFNIDHRSAETRENRSGNDSPIRRESKFETLEKPKNNFLSMSAKERSQSHNSGMECPKFGNDKCKSQISDGVDFHPLAQIDDFDINGEMHNKYQEERKGANITPTFKDNIEGSVALKSAVETDEADFERDECEPLPKINLFSTFKSQLKVMSDSIRQIKESKSTVSELDSSILKKCAIRLAEKLKEANSQIELLKLEQQHERANFQIKLDEANK